MAGLKKTTFFRKALTDPLFHFLVLGGLLYIVYAIWGSEPKFGANQKNNIVITQAGQQHLADLFSLTWQREPTADELEHLIEEHIKEEVYYREALALGLDENDTIVRRRLQQKLEFMQEDISSLAEPTKAELKAYYLAHKDNYKTEQIFSFQQIVVAQKKLDKDDAQFKSALSSLNSGTPPKNLNRSTLLPIHMKLEAKRTVTNTFGNEFTQQISRQELHRWSGPVYSGFGTHLVNMSLSQKSKPLTFVQAKRQVAVDFTRSQRELAAENYYKNLRDKYNITVIKPE